MKIRMQNRRRFVAGMGAFTLGAMSGAVRAAMGPDDKFDLVIKGGELLDPGRKLRGKRDIGMRNGKIEAIDADIPAARANRLLDAGGKIVLPGLIDLPERCANVCFGGLYRNRLFMAASTSVYSLYVNTQGVAGG